MILLKRAYDQAAHADGERFLVERLWPRGIKKTALPLAGWLRDIAPSPELTKRFRHDPAKWKQFQRRYRAELKTSAQVWEPLVQKARRGTITLVYSSHDIDHNNAVVLKEFLEEKLGHQTKAA